MAEGEVEEVAGPQELREKGNEAFKAKKYKDAITFYTQAIRIAEALSNTTDLKKLYSNRAASYIAVNEWQEGVDDAERAIDLDPEWVKPYFHLQKALKKLHNYDGAKMVLEKANELAPGSEELRVANNELKRLMRKTIEDYELGKELGSGNFTSIFYGTDKKTKQPVAIKIGDRAQIAHKKKGHELNREKDILSRCDHPNVVKLYEAFIDEVQIYMVLEYCELDLFEMSRKIGLAEQTARFYLAQVLAGLSYLHSKEIMHRDLKSENLMVDKTTGLLKIIDFGTAKDMRNPKLDEIVEKGPVRQSFVNYVGTPQFMSPECIRNKVCAYPSDCYSFGCLVFQLLHGLPPFMAGSEYLVLLRVMNHDLEFPEDTSEDAIDLIKNCVTPEARDRLTMTQIKNHPWFTNNREGVSYFLEETIPNTDKDSLTWLEKHKPKALDVIKEEDEEEEEKASPDTKEKSSSTDTRAASPDAKAVSSTAKASLADENDPRHSPRDEDQKTLDEPHKNLRYFQRNPAVKRPILPLTWHCLLKLRDNDDKIYEFQNTVYRDDATKLLQKRFLTLDSWERQARPGQGPSAKMQGFLDADAAKLDEEERSKVKDEDDLEIDAIVKENLEAGCGKSTAKELGVAEETYDASKGRTSPTIKASNPNEKETLLPKAGETETLPQKAGPKEGWSEKSSEAKAAKEECKNEAEDDDPVVEVLPN